MSSGNGDGPFRSSRTAPEWLPCGVGWGLAPSPLASKPVSQGWLCHRVLGVFGVRHVSSFLGGGVLLGGGAAHLHLLPLVPGDEQLPGLGALEGPHDAPSPPSGPPGGRPGSSPASAGAGAWRQRPVRSPAPPRRRRGAARPLPLSGLRRGRPPPCRPSPSRRRGLLDLGHDLVGVLGLTAVFLTKSTTGHLLRSGDEAALDPGGLALAQGE